MTVYGGSASSQTVTPAHAGQTAADIVSGCRIDAWLLRAHFLTVFNSSGQLHKGTARDDMFVQNRKKGGEDRISKPRVEQTNRQTDRQTDRHGS